MSRDAMGTTAARMGAAPGDPLTQTKGGPSARPACAGRSWLLVLAAASVALAWACGTAGDPVGVPGGEGVDPCVANPTAPGCGGGEDGGPLPQCEEGERVCVGAEVRQCLGGSWSTVKVCGGGQVCQGGECVAPCTPACGTKTCGDDGCGGSCGECAAGLQCRADGTCGEPCTASCVGKACGDDGCGGSCGTCGGELSCVDGACTTACTPDCGAKTCGDDGCGGSCGSCSDDEKCQFGQCTPLCTPDCVGKSCGDDGCGGSCGGCPSGLQCLNGQCDFPCDADCDGKECGGDGCGGVCGTCSGPNDSCVSGLCIDTCEPTCGFAQCGDDGCGATCGQCAFGDDCLDGYCATPGAYLCWDILGCVVENGCSMDPVCEADCVALGSAAAQSEANAFFACFDTCTTWSCMATNCAQPAAMCLFEGAGTLDCEAMYECIFDCEAGDDLCDNACGATGTLLAQSQYMALNYCLQGACPDTAPEGCVSDAISLGGECASYYSACFP